MHSRREHGVYETGGVSGEEYERLYRAEYMAFYRFLTSFYEMHRDKDSYFWEARKVLGSQEGSAMDAFIAYSTAWRFSTGRTPGCPRQTGQVCEFGGAPKEVEQPQKILDAV